LGVSLNTGASDAIIQTIFPDYDYATGSGGSYSSVCGGQFAPNCSGIGAAVTLNTSIGSQKIPLWTVGSNEYVQMNAIALKGSSGNSGRGRWTFVQESYWSNFGAVSGPGGSNCGLPLINGGGGSISWTVNLLQPVAPGNLLIITPLFYTDPPFVVTLTSINGETITKCTACQVLVSNKAIQLDMAYVLSAVGGEQTITCNFSAISNGWNGCGVTEVHWGGSGGITYDTGGATLISCSTVCPGVNLKLNGNNDFMFQSNVPLSTNPYRCLRHIRSIREVMDIS
jgi:hypothetical protein